MLATAQPLPPWAWSSPLWNPSGAKTRPSMHPQSQSCRRQQSGGLLWPHDSFGIPYKHDVAVLKISMTPAISPICVCGQVACTGSLTAVNLAPCLQMHSQQSFLGLLVLLWSTARATVASLPVCIWHLATRVLRTAQVKLSTALNDLHIFGYVSPFVQANQSIRAPVDA